ncbi:MAG: HAD hydrolase-like protein, partial [Brevundimonas sp.]|nr:HAD hydrolase-like protein [Brevundimonas sp.]
MTRPLAIFDIDGTLVDSRESIFLAATEAALALGLPEPEYDRVRKIVGLSLPEAMRTLEPQLTAPELDRFVEAFRQCFHRLYAEGHEEPLYPGATDLLRRLHRDGWRLSLATG